MQCAAGGLESCILVLFSVFFGAVLMMVFEGRSGPVVGRTKTAARERER